MAPLARQNQPWPYKKTLDEPPLWNNNPDQSWIEQLSLYIYYYLLNMEVENEIIDNFGKTVLKFDN